MQFSTLTAILSLALLSTAAPAPSKTTCWTNPKTLNGRVTGIGFMLTAPDWSATELSSFRTRVSRCGLVSGSFAMGPAADEARGIAYRMGVIPNDTRQVVCLEDAIDDAMSPKLKKPVRCKHKSL